MKQANSGSIARRKRAGEAGGAGGLKNFWKKLLNAKKPRRQVCGTAALGWVDAAQAGQLCDGSRITVENRLGAPTENGTHGDARRAAWALFRYL
jgi:hypothetical protein